MMIVFSVSHKDAAASTIARLGREAHTLRQRLSTIPAVRGAVVLTTCARLEAYVDAARFHDAHRAFVDALAEGADLPMEHVAALTRSQRGQSALEHAFRVTAGLESAVVGEVQIAGQVRDALAAARRDACTTRSLDIAFENALRVSRLARVHLNGGAGSIVAAALDRVGGAHPATEVPLGMALVIGTGTFARLADLALRERGVHTVLVHSPSGRTPAFGDGLIDTSELTEALMLADLVVCASGHGEIVVSADRAEHALLGRATRLTLVDLAASGDVDAALDEHPEIDVIRMDDVRAEVEGADIAAAIVTREAIALYPRIEGREVDDIIVALRAHVQAAVGRGTDDPGLAEAVRRVTQALLHEPTIRAREAARAGELERYRSALETVFGIPAGLGAQPIRVGEVL